MTPELVERDLGAPRFRTDTEVAERTRRPGVAVGLAWTPVGGDVLFIEAGRMPGGNKGLIMTGQLGPVMQESVQAALTWVRANATRYGIDPDLFKTSDIHIHVPAGAIPKDGPSAGITMATALLSMLEDRCVRSNLAMTGEITLAGQVLPVGGIKEKVLAAKRSGVRELILPFENEVDVREDLKSEQIEDMKIHYVKAMEQVVELALERDGKPGRGRKPAEAPAYARTASPVGARRLRIWFITSDARNGLRSTGKLCSSQSASSSGGRMVPVMTITSICGTACRNSTPSSTPLPSGSM